MHIEPHPDRPDGPSPRLIEPALESLLNQSMLQVEVVAELHRCGSWFLSQPRYRSGLFHLVGAGRCTFECPALGEPMQLEAGDLVVLPQGEAHRLSVDVPGHPEQPDRTVAVPVAQGQVLGVGLPVRPADLERGRSAVGGPHRHHQRAGPGHRRAVDP